MTLNEIRAAVKAGEHVCWENDAYGVVTDYSGNMYIVYMPDGNCISLTWSDGVTLNGDEKDFYIKS